MSVIRERPRSLLSSGLVAVAAVSLLVAVLLSDGFVARTYDLDDAYVWVTKAGELMRFNNQTRQLDWKGSPEDGKETDVIQDGTDVFAKSERGWWKVDVAEQKFDQLTNFANASIVDVGGGTLAASDDNGNIWAVPVDQASQIPIDADGAKQQKGKKKGAESSDDKSKKGAAAAKRDLTKPVFRAGIGALLAVGRGGDVAVLTGDRSRLVVIGGHGDDEPVEKQVSGTVSGTQTGEISLVGHEAVALVGSSLIRPDGSVTDLSVETARLQLPGDTSDDVVVASANDLLSIPLGGGKPVSLTEAVKFGGSDSGDQPAGTPERPVSVGGQIAAVWSGAGARVFWKSDSDQLAQLIPDFSGADLRFRVNRNAVVLNRQDNGEVFVLADGELSKSEWQDPVKSPETKAKKDDAKQEKIITFDPTKNKPPTANPDKYGARPGLPTIIHPLDNDTDPDSDVLTIDLDEASLKQSHLKVAYVEGKQGLQVTPDGNSSPGSELTFQYRANDGSAKGMSQPAQVKITLYGPGDNSAPELKPGRSEDPPSMEVVAASPTGSEYQVLQDYWDPEGDPFYLLSATAADPVGSDVAFQNTGRVTYIDKAGAAAETSVKVKLTDAPLAPNVTPAASDGTLRVSVRPSESDLPPIARNDYVSTVEGVPVVIRPLANDEDPNGDQLSFKLEGLDQLDRNEVTVTESANNTVTVTAKTPGQFAFGYELSAGGASATARIRVDVTESAVASVPSAALDLVVLPRPTEGSPAQRVVDLLANDFSPSGDVLTVTSVDSTTAKNSNITAQLLELRRLRVSSDSPPRDPVSFGYTLSDGRSQVAGTVVVVESPESRNAPPVAVDDKVTVRSGDLVSVPVLANDIDPEGSRLYLDPHVEELSGQNGVVWASGQRVRLLAPSIAPGQSKTLNFAYTVFDGDDFKLAKRALGKLQVRVTNPGEKTNSPPKPEPVEARVLAGKQVKITIPTAGIDPDGDSVQLVGVGFNNGVPEAPKKGRIVGEPGVDSFVYEALPGQAGTDIFSYVVVDSHGERGTGQVRVGVAANDRNNPPVAFPDKYQALPGKPMTLDVLLNDIDPDGDSISLVKDDPFMKTGGEVSAKRVELGDGRDGVHVEVPNKDGEQFSFRYRIADSIGELSDQTVTLQVTSKAAGQPPVAHDDRAVVDGLEVKTVKVPVLENDADPDGDVADLTLEVVGSVGKPVHSSSGLDQIEVPLVDHPQIVVYRITDAQGLRDYAVVRVPAAGSNTDRPPVWKPAGPCAKEVKFEADRTEQGIVFDGNDKPLVIDLAKCGFKDPEGESVRFSSGGSITKGVNGKLATSVAKGGSSFEISDSQGGKVPYQDVISLVVTDGGTSSTGNEVLVQIPVGVTATSDKAENQEPAWTGSATIEVSQDGEPSKAIDLRKLVKDPEGDDLKFALATGTGSVKGVKVDGDLAKGSLQLVGSKDLPLGEAGVVAIAVTDSKAGHKAVQKDFTINAIKTHKAPPTLKPHATVEDATLNKKSTVNVLEGAQDPVGGGLNLTSVSVGEEAGTASSDVNGDLTFQPARVGPSTVSFTVIDSLDRAVTGTVTYAVAAPPGPPGAPSALGYTFDSVSLRWSQAEDNRSEISRYDVTASPGGAKASCGTELSCTVKGLVPGTPYTFTVTATNEKGEGEASPPSPAITPDECPAAPQNVQLVRDESVAGGGTNPITGQQLMARWEAPTNNGTAVQGYQISVEPGGQVLTPGPTATEQVISGLTNGENYEITIKARNSCEATFGDEASAGPAIPAGVPDAPTNVVATPVYDPAGQRVQLKWTMPSDSAKPSDNGDRVKSYTITEVKGLRSPEVVQASQVLGADGSSNPVSGTVTYEIKVDKKATNLRFTVAAENSVGIGPASAPSPPVSAPGSPLAPRLTAAVVSSNGTVGLDGRVLLQLEAPSDSGGDNLPLTYQYSRNSGAWVDLDSSRMVSGLTNGSVYSFRIRAKNYMYESAPSNQLTQVQPYGPLANPTLNGSNAAYGVSHVSFSWSAPPGNGRRVVAATVTVDGALVSSSLSGSAVSRDAWNHPFTVRVSVRDEAGQTSVVEKVYATGSEPPPPWASKFVGKFGVDVFSSTSGGSRVGHLSPWTYVTVRCRAEKTATSGFESVPKWYWIEVPGGINGFASTDTFWDAGNPDNPVDQFAEEWDPRVTPCP